MLRAWHDSAMRQQIEYDVQNAASGLMHTHSGLKILEPHSGMLRAWHDSTTSSAPNQAKRCASDTVLRLLSASMCLNTVQHIKAQFWLW
jgi:hypothetical protein